jgi:cytochrome P450
MYYRCNAKNLIGPVVRITPNEVLLSDAANFDKIYYVGSKYIKDSVFYGSLMVHYSSFGTVHNEVHRRRRSRLNPLFSRKMVLELQEIVQKCAKKVIARSQECFDRGEPVDLHHATRCVSIDVITEYAFDKGWDLLDSPDFGVEFFRLVGGIGPAFHIFQQIPFMQKYAYAIPPSIAVHLGGSFKQVTALQQECLRNLQSTKTAMDAGTLGGRKTIFSECLKEDQDAPPLPIIQLKDEVYSVIAAAAETTGNAMSYAIYKILSTPEIYAALREELLAAFPDPAATLDLTVLERLPYLVGISSRRR